jgi:hypothetical protein
LLPASVFSATVSALPETEPASVPLISTAPGHIRFATTRSEDDGEMNTSAVPERLIALSELVDLRTLRVSVVPDAV